MVLLCAAVLLPGCGAQDESAGQGTASSGVEQIAADGVVKMDSGAGTEETEDRAGEEPSEKLAGAETDEATGEVSGSTQDSGEIPAGSEVIPAEGTDPEEAAPPPEYLIQNFPIIYQMPELPTGCGDPISGQVEYDRQQFESVFASRGNQCVILEEE